MTGSIAPSISSLNQSVLQQPQNIANSVDVSQYGQVAPQPVAMSQKQTTVVPEQVAVLPQQTANQMKPAQQQLVDAQTYLGQLPKVEQVVPTRQEQVAPAEDALKPSVVPVQESTQPLPVVPQQAVSAQPKKNKLDRIVDFIKSDKCAYWTGGILSTVALVTYALAPKRPPQPGIIDKMKNYFAGVNISFPKLSNFPGVQAFKNFVHNTRKFVF